jgi:glycosyltransferase involved in cell wall biosynthesis
MHAPPSSSAPLRRARRVSILIPAYNEERNITPLLNFLRTHPLADHPVESEIWIDVSGSTDRTGEIAVALAREGGNVHVIDSGRRDGLLLALDRLIACATGDVVIRMDADLRMFPETLPALVRALEEQGAGIASPRIVPARIRGRFTSKLAAGQWGLHDQVSRLSPKTTLIQAFWNCPVRLKPEAGLEDQALQDELVLQGAVPAYVRAARVEVLPPSDLPSFVHQRVRSLRHLRAYRRAGGARPSTASSVAVGPALLAAVRDREPGITELVVFLAVEAWCRAAGRLPRPGGNPLLFQWEPISSTKEPAWAGPSPPFDPQ